MSDSTVDLLKSGANTQASLSLLLSGSGDEASFQHKYLTFWLADGCYAAPILKIQEIISLLPITPVPFTDQRICGLINLRGRVVSVMDLRQVLGLSIAPPTSLTSIMVIRIQMTEQMITMGGIVDRVASVLDIPEDNIDPPPGYANEVDVSLLKGMTKIDEQVVMILDIDKIIETLNPQEQASAE